MRNKKPVPPENARVASIEARRSGEAAESLSDACLKIKCLKEIGEAKALNA
ncbi:MAG: hypothetical protein LBU32_16075 [Clostridiales bacterium]|nr:hypothetical protein [Clostridiales bacterium]